jgi:hypothetical protein
VAQYSIRYQARLGTVAVAFCPKGCTALALMQGQTLHQNSQLHHATSLACDPSKVLHHHDRSDSNLMRHINLTLAADNKH